MKYDYAVVIGRFQPLHVGHERVLKLAAQKAKKLIILVGSSGRHRSPKNPFTFSERCSMIARAGIGADCFPIHDHPYNDDAWVTEVRDAVADCVPTGANVCLVGFRKDASSYYQSMFPEWDYVEVPSQYGTFNATDIRRQYIQDSPIISEFLNDSIRGYLKEFVFTETFKWLVNERKSLDKDRATYGDGPFVTIDTVGVQAGHILLVKRKHPPYAGALALPGGFLEPGEKILDGCLRELREETHIADSKGEIPPKMLESFIKKVKVFDHPERSERGRVITVAHKFEFPSRTSGLYKIRGDDDACYEGTRWYAFSELRKDMFMDDHADIIEDMTGVKL